MHGYKVNEALYQMVTFMTLSSGILALGKGHMVKLYEILSHCYVTLVTKMIF